MTACWNNTYTLITLTSTEYEIVFKAPGKNTVFYFQNNLHDLHYYLKGIFPNTIFRFDIKNSLNKAQLLTSVAYYLVTHRNAQLNQSLSDSQRRQNTQPLLVKII